MKRIKVIDIVGSKICVSDETGEKLLNYLKKELQAGEEIEISFQNISMVISRFLNVGIGRLYKEFNYDLVDKNIKYLDLDDDDLELLLEKVIPNAKQHFKDEKKSNNLEKEVLDD